MTAQTFAVGDRVNCHCEEYNCVKVAEIIALRDNGSRAYIHFDHEDKRLDRWVPARALSPYVEIQQPSPEQDRVLSRRDRERMQDGDSDEESLTPDIQQFENLHRQLTKIRNIEQITISSKTIRTWYYSPYPGKYHDAQHLYICDHCFKYFAMQQELEQHLAETKELRPPGREIYRKDNISVFELHGKRQKLECQCLCLLAKLFLDHKTLFYDVEGFVFYVLCECDAKGAHIAAYFSRELVSEDGNILACIVALPPYQKKGYGRLLISLSYEIAKRQHRSGGPERPLSDLGKIAFHAYWKNTLVEVLKNYGKDIQTLDDLVRMTSISRDDVIDVLREMNCVSKAKGEYELMVQKETLATAIRELEQGKPRMKVDPSCLIWLDGDDEKTDFTVPS